MRSRMFFLAVALSLAVATAHAATIYDADFSGAEGITHTTSSPAPAGPHSVDGPNWTFSYPTSPSTDTTANFARAAGDRFETEDWGGEAQVISDSIDVSSYDAVDIQWDGTTVGSEVFNNPAGGERFEWFYTLDAGAPVVQSTTSDGSLGKLLSAVDVSGATSLAVGFAWNVNGSGDGFDVFGLNVSGEPAIEIPEPATAILTGMIFACLGLVRKRG